MNRLASLPSLARATGLALFSALALTAGASAASPNFPSVVRDHVPMQCTPDCTICHTESPGTAGSAKKAFAETLMNRACRPGEMPPGCTGEPQGLKPTDANSLIAAIQRTKDASTDSDNDGVLDYLELDGTMVPATAVGQLTTDPNTAEAPDAPSADVCPPEPLYGCGAAHLTPKPHFHGELLLLSLLTATLGAGLWRRRIARRRSS